MNVNRDTTRGLAYLKNAVAQQQPEAMAYMGLAKALGLGGTAVNPSEAVDLFQRSAMAGSPMGAFSYAVALKNADGTARDLAASAHWMERAAVPGQRL